MSELVNFIKDIPLSSNLVIYNAIQEILVKENFLAIIRSKYEVDHTTIAIKIMLKYKDSPDLDLINSVKVIIDKDTKQNEIQDDQGNNLLMYVVNSRNKGLCKMLIDKGIGLDKRNNKGESIFSLAIIHNKNEIIVDDGTVSIERDGIIDSIIRKNYELIQSGKNPIFNQQDEMASLKQATNDYCKNTDCDNNLNVMRFFSTRMVDLREARDILIQHRKHVPDFMDEDNEFLVDVFRGIATAVSKFFNKKVLSQLSYLGLSSVGFALMAGKVIKDTCYERNMSSPHNSAAFGKKVIFYIVKMAESSLNLRGWRSSGQRTHQPSEVQQSTASVSPGTTNEDFSHERGSIGRTPLPTGVQQSMASLPETPNGEPFDRIYTASTEVEELSLATP